MARFAPLYEVPIADAACDVRATFFNTEKYDVDDEAPYFEQIEIRLSVDSPAAADQVQRLVTHAERACHAAQSFRQPIAVSLRATHTGTEVPLAVD